MLTDAHEVGDRGTLRARLCGKVFLHHIVLLSGLPEKIPFSPAKLCMYG
jgi:hypothetical protein